MNKEHAFGLPRGTVRGTVLLLLVAGFLVLTFLTAHGVITKQMEVEKAGVLIGLFSPVLIPVLNYYFESGRRKDENGHGTNGNGGA